LDYIARATEVIDCEIEGLRNVRTLLGAGFTEAVELILAALRDGGKVVITGVGKNVHIGHKIAATLTSTGTPAVLMHPIEALHGDFGLLGPKDVVLAMSYSGASDELTALIPAIKRSGNPIITLTGDPQSPLAQHSQVVIPVTVEKEACPFNMAPTSSTTATLAVGDALAMVLLEARGFKKEDYAKLHPGGAIGRTLLLRVRDVMRTGERCAIVHSGSPVKEAVGAMTRARSGCVAVTDPDQRLLGIFTDGDLRRHLLDGAKVLEETIDRVMTADPVTVREEQLAVDLLRIYEDRNIDDLIVLDRDGRVCGAVDIQDLPKLKIL